MAETTLDINATFRGGGRSVEFLDEINQASVVMLAETGIVPRAVVGRTTVAMMFTSLDLPAPSGPSSPKISPRRTAIETPRSASTRPA